MSRRSLLETGAISGCGFKSRCSRIYLTDIKRIEIIDMLYESMNFGTYMMKHKLRSKISISFDIFRKTK